MAIRHSRLAMAWPYMGGHAPGGSSLADYVWSNSSQIQIAPRGEIGGEYGLRGRGCGQAGTEGRGGLHHEIHVFAHQAQGKLRRVVVVSYLLELPDKCGWDDSGLG